jgi:hypothetical protein
MGELKKDCLALGDMGGGRAARLRPIVDCRERPGEEPEAEVGDDGSRVVRSLSELEIESASLKPRASSSSWSLWLPASLSLPSVPSSFEFSMPSAGGKCETSSSQSRDERLD